MTPGFLSILLIALMFVTLDGAKIDASSGVSDIIEEANKYSTTMLIDGDIRPNIWRNAAPCTARGCLWPKTGRYVYVPFTISRQFSRRERKLLIRTLKSFHCSTCIRFVPRRKGCRRQRNYLHFFSGKGCWSSVGRQRGGQTVSLQRHHCMSRGIIQHEVLHALGFKHEQTRSDRDRYVNILTQNIQPSKLHNFRKVATNNLNTPYDFGSVMHYSRNAFSRNGQPTILAKGNPNLKLGGAKQMSANDIARVNRLYRCCG